MFGEKEKETVICLPPATRPKKMKEKRIMNL